VRTSPNARAPEHCRIGNVNPRINGIWVIPAVVRPLPFDGGKHDIRMTGVVNNLSPDNFIPNMASLTGARIAVVLRTLKASCRSVADFVAEVGDDKSVAAGANFLS
jgi:hypothetical protein